ncbi:unnamed protein product [Parnassius mnemosyne]|uniref:Peptidase aspartic putative domain-containing protein n=1 Tax=Parnassius mnemosyne TaxID=213953 RepID=A0AAV1K406_9NEOP
MDKIINLQRETQNVINKAYSNYKKCPKERLTYEYLETRLEILDSNWQSFIDNHKKLYEHVKPEDLQTSDYVKLEVYDKTEDTYIVYKSHMKSAKNKLCPSEEKPQRSDLTPFLDKQCAVKLPRITIPTFSGKYSEWTTFRDLFLSLVHKNESLDNVQRLHYLKSHLTGEAAQLIRHTPVTETNYKESWDVLEKRYNNKRYLSNCILKRLFGQKRIYCESASSLKELLDTTMDCLCALKNLDIDVSKWDIIVIYLVSYKLDAETRKQWELFIASDDSLPTIDTFKIFIENRFRALETIEPRKILTHNATHSPNTKVLLATKSFSLKCEYCSQNHKLCFCKQFSSQDVDRRREFVSTRKMCFNCLGRNHLSYDCKKPTKCRICQKRHHTLLHPTNNQEKKDQAAVLNQSASCTDTSESEVPVVACLSTGHIPKPRQVLLATALIRVESKTGEHKLVRALIDQGSQGCFITEAIVQYLQLKKIPAVGVISGLSNNKVMRAQSKVRFQVQSCVDPNFKMGIEAYVLSKITDCLPERKIEAIAWEELNQLTLADPQFNIPNKIDILLGADVYSTIIRHGIKKCPNGSLIAQNTTLGWILSGVINNVNGKNNTSTMKLQVMHAQVMDNEILKRFWEIEESKFYNEKKIHTEEEQKCEKIYETTTKRTPEGRYIVKLPLRDEELVCKNGNSREIAIKRLKSLETRLSKNQELREKYHNVLKEYLQLGHMRSISNHEPRINEPIYLPHHAVVREDKSTTKVRVVFNASEPNKFGVSLNDALMVGPTLQADLRHTMLRWRTHPIALVADIVKMYRQVLVAEADANMYQRIVWREDPKEEIKDYELLTFTFGTASAPYLAVRTLHRVVYDAGVLYPIAAEQVLNCFYMDDLMTGCDTVQEGCEIVKQLKELLGQAGFELQKWNSNSKRLMKHIEQGEEKDTIIKKTKLKDNKGAVKLLENEISEVKIRSDDTIKILRTNLEPR